MKITVCYKYHEDVKEYVEDNSFELEWSLKPEYLREIRRNGDLVGYAVQASGSIKDCLYARKMTYGFASSTLGWPDKLGNGYYVC